MRFLLAVAVSIFLIGQSTAQTITSPGAGGIAGTAAGDLTGTYPSPTVASIGGKVVTLGGALTTSGANALTFTTTGTTNITLPTAGTLVGSLTATSAAIGGGALLAGACATTNTTVTGAAVGNIVDVAPNTFPGVGTTYYGYVSSANTVTVNVCAIVGVTPSSSTYSVRVLQ